MHWCVQIITSNSHNHSMLIYMPFWNMWAESQKCGQKSCSLVLNTFIWLGVNHYRYNHYQWPPLPYDTHYQWQSLPDDNHYHWQPLPATTTRFHLARKPLPATTTTWQQLPYDDHYRMTTITIWRPPPHYQNYHISFNHMLFAKMYVQGVFFSRMMASLRTKYLFYRTLH